MKKLTPKTKKVIIFAGMLIICAGVLSLVFVNANAGGIQSDSSSSDTSAEIVLASPDSITVPSINSESGTGSAFVPSSGAVASEPLTSVSKPTSAPAKPTPPASSALTNKAKKPTYSSKPAVKKSSSKSSSKTATPAGKTYVPGFGYVDGTGGGQMIKMPDAGGDINKQVGTMD